MKFGFQFSNLCGTVYRSGSLCFSADGSAVISPVGNRASVFDLVNHTSYTLGAENSKNIVLCEASPDGSTLFTSDEDGRSLLISMAKKTVLAHMNFHQKVNTLKWSPDGRFVAVGLFKCVEVWSVPATAMGAAVSFAPFRLLCRLHGHHDQVTCIDWAGNGEFIVSASLDNTVHVYNLRRFLRTFSYEFPDESEIIVAKKGAVACATFAAHSDKVIGCFFEAPDKLTRVYVVTRDSKLTTWQWVPRDPAVGEVVDEENDPDDIGNPRNGRWTIADKQKISAVPGQKVKCCTFVPNSQLLVVGFNRGVFALLTCPEMRTVQTLSISNHSISSVAVNKSGEWIAFASKKLGQLLVWEWRSETYVMKQQGHLNDISCLAYSPNGQLIATGSDDGKVKIWDTRNWFCFVTFNDHTGPVTAVRFAPNGLSVVSSSLDGTVRAFDLIRYRNYRVLSPPTPTQLSCLALDASGEICVAGAQDSFEIFVWSLQTGKLLDVLSGHEGPVSCLAFNPNSQVLASASWDHTVRLWETFEGRPYREALEHTADCLALAWKPDGSELCTSALDGSLNFWDTESGTLLGTIDGRNDIRGGRRADDVRTAATNPRGTAFTSISYSQDGQCVLASGESKWICLYEISRKMLVKRFQTSHNVSLDGVLDFLNSANMTEAGAKDTFDLHTDDEGDDDDIPLPGAQKPYNDPGARNMKLAIMTKQVSFSPDGRAWAAATTEGLLVYSLDADMAAFDPCELDVDVTEETVLKTIAEKDHMRAVLMALRLGEKDLVRRAFENVPPTDIQLIAQNFPIPYIARLLEFIGKSLEATPHVQVYLLWTQFLLFAHAEYIRGRASEFAPVLRVLHRQLARHKDAVSSKCTSNKYMLEYIAARMRAAK